MGWRTLAAAGISAFATLIAGAAPAMGRVLPVLASPQVPATSTGEPAGDLGDALLEATRGAAVLRMPVVRLPAGRRHLVQSCLQVHVWGAAPVVRCAASHLDTSGATGVTEHPGPEVSLPVTDADVAWATGRVDIAAVTSTGGWEAVGSTLPGGSGIPPAIDLRPSTAGADLDPAPAQGVDIGLAAGGFNSGDIGSFCVPAPVAATAGPPAGVTANALGADAPAYSELGFPIGVDANRARGVVLALHGGGWFRIGPGGVQTQRPEAERWRRRGWLSVNATYRACGDAPADVRWFVRRIRERFPALPVVVVGGSAGGHLALLAASQLPDDVAGVVASGAPASLADLRDETASHDSSGATQIIGPRWVYNLAVAAFGEENLDAFSPQPAQLRARILLATASSDGLVPFSQASRLRDEVRAHNPAANIDAMQLAPGDVPWVHAHVSEPALADFLAREDALAQAVGRVYLEPAAPAPLPTAGPATPAPSAAPAVTAPVAAALLPIAINPDHAVAGGGPTKSTTIAPLGEPSRPTTLRILTNGPRSVSLSIDATASGRIELALTLDRRDARRLDVHPRLATATYELAAGRRRTVRLRLPRKLQRALRSRRTRVARASLAATWLSMGTSSRVTTRFTLRRPSTSPNR